MKKLTLLLISSLPVMAGAIIAAAVPHLAEVFVPYGGDARLLAKLMVTLPALFVAFFAPLMGYLSDRYGRLPVLLSGLMLFVLAGTSGLYLVHPYALLTGRALLGVGVAAIMTTSVALAGDLFDGAERQAFLGQQGSFMALGGLVYLTLGGWLADFHWRLPFIIYFIALVFVLLAKLHFPKSGRPVAPQTDLAHEAAAIPWKPLSGLYSLSFLCMLAFYLIPIQAPFVLKERFGADGLVIGLTIGFSTFFSAATGLAYGKLKARLSYQRIQGLGLVVMALGYYLFQIAPSLPLAIAAMVPAGLGMGVTIPNINTWLVSFAPAAQRGRMLGGLTFFFFIGMFLSPVASSLLPSAQGVFSAASLGLLLLGLLLLALSLRPAKLAVA
ncbi:MAG: MFS transporter [bacterium]|nr:MFS transporter [bacterium]